MCIYMYAHTYVYTYVGSMCMYIYIYMQTKSVGDRTHRWNTNTICRGALMLREKACAYLLSGGNKKIKINSRLTKSKPDGPPPKKKVQKEDKELFRLPSVKGGGPQLPRGWCEASGRCRTQRGGSPDVRAITLYTTTSNCPTFIIKT